MYDHRIVEYPNQDHWVQLLNDHWGSHSDSPVLVDFKVPQKKTLKRVLVQRWRVKCRVWWSLSLCGTCSGAHEAAVGMEMWKIKWERLLVLVWISAEPSNYNKGVFLPINRLHSEKRGKQRCLVSAYPCPCFLTKWDISTHSQISQRIPALAWQIWALTGTAQKGTGVRARSDSLLLETSFPGIQRAEGEMFAHVIKQEKSYKS